MQGPDEVGVLTLGQLLDLGRRVEQSGLESLSSAERQAYEQARSGPRGSSLLSSPSFRGFSSKRVGRRPSRAAIVRT